MATSFVSPMHIFSLSDITGTFTGVTYEDDPTLIDTSGAITPIFVDKDGNELYGIDSEFGFYVSDFIGAEQKILDGDYAEGFAGNIYDPADPTSILGLALKNAETDIFRSGGPLGTWSLGLGGQTVKASTEHYTTMADVLSDQRFPGDDGALRPLDDDLLMRDLRPTGVGGTFEAGSLHMLWVDELTDALQRAIDNVGNPDQILSDIDFDRDNVPDTYRITTQTIDFDEDGDGVPESIQVGAVDLGDDGSIDLVDRFLNGFGGEADVTDILEPNESSVTYDIAYSRDYSVTLKDDGKLLYRFGEAVKRPNDIRMEVNLDLPEEWTADDDANGIADWVEEGAAGFQVLSARLVIRHDITNNPNDQVRPEDWENEAAIGRLPAHYIVRDPDDPSNTLWVSPVDSYNGEGDFLPSYLRLTATGEVDLVPQAGDVPVTDPDGNVIGFRNRDADGNLVGTVLRDLSLAEAAEDADLSFTSSDLEEGFTANWYTTVDREPFEWSYDTLPDDPYRQVFVSFRSPEDAAAAGYDEDSLVSGPRWRLTPNKFGQDLPGLEVPLEPNSPPPYRRDNIKYPTGEETVTVLNLLDWGEDEDGDGVPDASPLSHSAGWMLVDPDRLDEDGDGIIDEGWSNVDNGGGTLFSEGDPLPAGPILSAVTPNGLNLTHTAFDTSVYVKGDRSDSAKLYDMELLIEYAERSVMGTVQEVAAVDHRPVTVTYLNGQEFDDPVVFATPPTFNGSQPASVAFDAITSTEATLKLVEPDYLDGLHYMESVNLLTMESGTWSLDDGTRLEVGTQLIPAGPTNSYYTVTFDEAFDEAPVVLVQLQTDNGTDWITVRTRNVTTTSFQVGLQEEEASDGIQDAAEVVGWLAIDPSDPTDVIQWGDIAAQALTEERAADHTGGEVTFDAAIGLDPLISANIASTYGTNPAMLRLREVTDDGTAATADFLVQEERSADTEVWHYEEDIAILAFEDAGLLTGLQSSTIDTVALV